MARILLDTCVWGKARIPLEAMGHDVVWSGDWEPDPGDIAILETAYREKRILVTLDKDFGELAILKGQQHSGLIRLIGFRVLEMADMISILVQRHERELLDGGIIVATPGKVRIRPSAS